MGSSSLVDTMMSRGGAAIAGDASTLAASSSATIGPQITAAVEATRSPTDATGCGPTSDDDVFRGQSRSNTRSRYSYGTDSQSSSPSEVVTARRGGQYSEGTSRSPNIWSSICPGSLSNSLGFGAAQVFAS